MLNRIGQWSIEWARRCDPWTNVYGLARTLIATSTLMSLLWNPTTTWFHPVLGNPEGLSCTPGTVGTLGLFCLPLELTLLRALAIVGLLVVASGWRPRYTGILHWWISASLFWNSPLVDGGEQISMILTLLLIPVTLLDPRRWHWSRREVSGEPSDGELARRLVARFAIVAIRIQMAVLYFHAGAGKLEVPEWVDGSVLYYWFTEPTFGAAGLRGELVWPIITQPNLVTLATWSVLVGEGLLAAGLLADRRYWKYLLWLGVTFHFGIFLIHGLPSFVLSMWGGLLIFYRPADEPLRFGALRRVSRWFSRRARPPVSSPASTASTAMQPAECEG